MFNYAEYKTNILRGQKNQVQTWLWQSGCLILLYFYQTDITETFRNIFDVIHIQNGSRRPNANCIMFCV